MFPQGSWPEREQRKVKRMYADELTGCVDWASKQGPGSVPVDPKERAYFENSSLPEEQPDCV